jgi:hypothetical protein
VELSWFAHHIVLFFVISCSKREIERERICLMRIEGKKKRRVEEKEIG